MIINNKHEIVLTEEQKEEMFWDNWKFDSHRWHEHGTGYFECEYCGKSFTSQMPLSAANLCSSNPYVIQLSKENQ